MSGCLTYTTSIVINQCCGGYSLSQKAALELAKRKNITLVKTGQFLIVKDTHHSIEYIVPRNDPDLVDIVRTLGKAANGYCADLRIKNIVITLELSEHDGYERIGSAYAEET